MSTLDFKGKQHVYYRHPIVPYGPSGADERKSR